MKHRAFFLMAFASCATAQAIEAPLDVRQSSLHFTGHATLHDFHGQAQDFSGSAQIDPAAANLVTSAVIDIAAAKMTTLESSRDRHMDQWLHVDTEPKITFRLDTIKCVSGDPKHADRRHPAQFVVRGDFTLHQMTKPLGAKVTGWREGALLVITGTAQIDTTAYGLPIIRQFFMTVDKNVDVTFRLAFDLPAGAR